jgi:hypothetical protein
MLFAAFLVAILAIFPHADAGRPFLLRRGESFSPLVMLQEEMAMSRMRGVRSVVAGSLAFGSSMTLAPDALAQQAVQWRVEDGGNGHWYQPVFEWLSYPEAVQSAIARGGHLATLTTEQENSFVMGLGLPYLSNGTVFGYWIGGMRSPTSGNWEWLTGETWAFSNFDLWEPNGCCGADARYLVFRAHPGSQGRWDDTSTNGNNDANPMPYIIEFESDLCLGDVTGNNAIDGIDLAAVLAAWGGGKSQFDCDIDDDGTVGGSDLAIVLAGWGACP